MRLPKRSASTSVRRSTTRCGSGPGSSSRSLANGAAQKKMPQPKAAAPRMRASALKPPTRRVETLARSRTTQIRRRVVSRAALDRLIDALHLVGEAHRDVAPGLEVVVHLHRGVEHR